MGRQLSEGATGEKGGRQQEKEMRRSRHVAGAEEELA